MKAGGEYAHAAANIDMILGTLLLVVMTLGMGGLIALRLLRRRQANASSSP
jgi:hypothetical protein